MKKKPLEEVIIGRSCEPHNSPSKYLGLEVSIGTLKDNSFADELEKLALKENRLWQKQKIFSGFRIDEGCEEDETYVSSFLEKAFKYNDIYHKDGLLFYESITTDEIEINLNTSVDRNNYSTDNFIFSTDIDYGGVLIDGKELSEKEVKDYFFNDLDQIYNNVTIPEKGNYILNIKFQDVYFRACGMLEKSKKRFNKLHPDLKNDYGSPEFSEKNTPKYEKNKFLITPYSDFFVIGSKGETFLEPFSILHTVKSGDEELIRQKDREQNLEYYSIHIIFQDSKIIGGLTNKNTPFILDESCFPIPQDNEYNVFKSIYWISPCPPDNTDSVYDKEGNHIDYKDEGVFEKLQDFIYNGEGGNSRDYGIPSNKREKEYISTIKKLVTLLRKK